MISKNSLLAIAIPTYNRAAILSENLSIMIDEIVRFGIPVYISDDSNNNETEELVWDIKKSYPYIYYNKNVPSLGHDKNCIKTLSVPDEEYVWYLGDAIIIKPGGIQEVLLQIEQYHPDFISVNTFDRVVGIPSKIYSDENLLLRELGWHLTMTGVTIYSKSVLNELDTFLTENYHNFPQVALIFQYIANKRCNFLWNDKILIAGNVNKKSYWHKDVFKVFIDDWSSCIDSLSDKYINETKEVAKVSHSLNTDLYSLKSLVSYRIHGFFSWSEYFHYFHDLRKHSKVNIGIVSLVVFLPRFVFTFFYRLYDKGRKRDLEPV